MDKVGKEIAGFLLVFVYLVLFGCTINLIAAKTWIGDLSGTLKVQMTLVLVIGVCIFFARNSRRLFILTLIALVFSVVPLLQLAFPIPIKIAGAAKNLKVVQLNVNYANKDLSYAVHLLKTISPDVICLEEVTAFGGAYFAKSLSEYPYRKIIPQPDSFGIAIFSKLPFNELRVFSLGRAKVPAILAAVSTGSVNVNLVALHVLPPITPQYFTDRNLEFEQLVQNLKSVEDPLAVIGDFNAPPWSFYFQKLCKDGGFIDSLAGFGCQATWPVGIPLLQIPIDNMLCRGPIRAMKRIVCGSVGSDHFPVCIDLEIGQKAK